MHIKDKKKEPLTWIIQQFRLFLFKPLKFNDLMQYQLSPVG